MSSRERTETIMRAFAAGKAARAEGKDPSANPYKALSSRGAWASGFNGIPDAESRPAADVTPDSRRARTLKQFASGNAIIANQRSRWNKIPAEEARIAEDEETRRRTQVESNPRPAPRA